MASSILSALPNWPSSGAAPAMDSVLWPVADQHLTEAAFLFEQIERAYDSPVETLETLARGVEARWLAHVDGLLVGGRRVYETMLRPVLEEPDPSATGGVAVAAA